MHGANEILARHERQPLKDIQVNSFWHPYPSFLQWYVEGARQFFKAVAEDLQGKPPRFGRSRPLVALPLIGTGKGGAKVSTGGMVVALFSVLDQAATEFGFDVALVTIKSDLFAAIQVERKRYAEKFGTWDKVLSNELKVEAQRLSVPLTVPPLSDLLQRDPCPPRSSRPLPWLRGERQCRSSYLGRPAYGPGCHGPAQ